MVVYALNSTFNRLRQEDCYLSSMRPCTKEKGRRELKKKKKNLISLKQNSV